MDLQPTHRNEKLFLVILSERSESKHPYTVYSRSLGKFFRRSDESGGLSDRRRSRRTPILPTKCTERSNQPAQELSRFSVTPSGPNDPQENPYNLEGSFDPSLRSWL